MAYIENLTEEQLALIPQFYDKWLKIGLSTETANRPVAEKAVAKVYKDQGFKAPKVVLWADSPLGGARLAALLARPKNAIKNPSGAKIRAMVEISDDNPEPTQKEINEQLTWGKLGFGNQDAHWLGYYDYFRTIGVENLEKAAGLIELGTESCWWWSYEYAAVLTDKPERLVIDEEGRLHSHDGMAIRFRDGFGMYAHHGIEVTEQIIMAPESLATEQIFGEPNAEVRRCMIEVLGYERLVAKATPKVLHADTDELGKRRQLLRFDLVDDEPVTIIRLTNSTAEPDGHFKNYYLRVHPELRPMFGDGTVGSPQEMTCANAVASTHGLTGTMYVLAAQT